MIDQSAMAPGLIEALLDPSNHISSRRLAILDP